MMCNILTTDLTEFGPFCAAVFLISVICNTAIRIILALRGYTNG